MAIDESRTYFIEHPWRVSRIRVANLRAYGVLDPLKHGHCGYDGKQSMGVIGE